MAEIKKINTELQLESALRDGNGSPGTNGQVLSSTGTATDWISLSEIQGVDGTGTANYISKWSDTDTITNSIIFDNGTNVGIGTTSPTKKLHVNGDAFFQNTVSLPDNAYVGLGSSFDFHLVHNGSNSSITNSTGNLNISSNGGDAVFNTASSERMRITSSGNIGVGTTSPSAKLHIEDGDVIVKNNSTNQYKWQYGSNQPTWSVGGGNYFTIKGGSTRFVTLNSSGNFGIGTTSPSQKLDVAGSINLTGNVFSDQGFYGNRLWNSDNTALRFATNNTERMRISSSGNVGVGTTTPTEKLEVAGNVKLDGDNRHIYFGGNNTFIGERSNSTELELRGGGNSSAQTVYIDNSGRIGVGTSNPTNKLQLVYTDTHTSGDLALANSAFDIYNDSTADVAGKGSTLTFSDNYLGTNKTTRAAIKGGTDTAGNTADGFLAFYTDSGGANSMQQRMIIDNDGNVGIGNTNPTKELEIGTNAAAETEFRMHSDVSGNYFNIQSAGNFTSVKTTGSQNFILDSSGSSGYITFVTTASERMRVNYNGNVGIGTTSPLAKLHIKDGNTLTSALANTSALVEGFNQSILQIASHSTGYSQIAFGDQDDGFDGGFIYSNASRYLAFEAANAERMRITSSGNVGIGTTSPSNRLEVVGSYAAVPLKVLRHGDYGNVINIGRNGVSETANIGYPADSTINLSTAGSEAMRITSSGNVGIGTTSPSEKLVVQDGKILAGHLNTRGYGFHDLSNYSYTANTGRLSLVSNGIEAVSIDSSQNVGIGTTSPSKTLHVRSANDAPFRVESTDATTGIQFKDSDSDNSLYYVGSGDYFYTSASLGIGTTSPGSKLHLADSSDVYLTLESTSATTPEEVAVKYSNQPTGSNYWWQGLNQSANWSLGYGTSFSGSSTKLLVDTSGNVGIGTTTPFGGATDRTCLSVNGTTDVSLNIGTGNTQRAYLYSNGAYTRLATIGTIPLTLGVNDLEKMRITSSGNVGIGTTSPGRKLSVNGSIELTGSDMTLNTTSAAIRRGTSGQMFLDAPGDVTVTIDSNSNNTDRVFNVRKDTGSELFRIQENGNVGIGTTSPDRALEVEGDIRSNGNIRAYQNNSSAYYTEINANSSWGYLQTTSSNFYINKPIRVDSGQIGSYNEDLQLKTGSTERVRISNTSGNVGIGTTSPLSKLNVNGGIKIEGENPLYFGSSGSVPLWEIKASGSDLVINDTGTNSGDLIFTGENLGVGITSPLYKLDVDGTLRTRAQTTSDWGLVSINSAAGATSGLWFNNGSGELLLRRSDNSLQTKISSTSSSYINGGDVGIGTTSPSERLHVSGEPHPSIRLSSSSDSDYNVVINCGYRDEALNLSVGGYKVFTTEGYNTPETTHLYSNNSKALSLASNQAATFTSTVTATNFINSSDERLKENIEKVCNNSLDVQWKTFEFKSDRGQKRYGVIAQELEKTNPEFVREDAEGFKSVAYIDLLIAKIAELEERIQTLENK